MLRLSKYNACGRSHDRCNANCVAPAKRTSHLHRGPFGIHSFEGGPDSPDFILDHPKWCSMLTSMVLRSRTSFAAYLAKSFRPSQTVAQSVPTVFPLPVPDSRPLFDRMPPGLSSSKRRSLHLGRALHVMCMALNFWHSGGCFSDLDLIGRPSTATHRSIFRRLKALLLSDVQFPATSMVRAGRRFPQLLARLGELSESVTYNGITSQPYSKDYEGVAVAKRNDLLPGLDPYRKADPERIKISGTGAWDATPLLPDDLVMVYREPAVIFNNRTVPEGLFPRIGETTEEVASLARLWDEHGLLFLHNFNVPDHDPQRQVRIFGAMKDPQRDRQIGDRRGMNYKEDRISGPSAVLPNGSDLTDLIVDLSSQKIHIAVCDRKDFYHQIWVSKRRAVTNSLGPGVPASLLEGTKALNTYLLQDSLKKKRRADRREVGDHLHAGAGLHLPVFEDDRLCVSFKSVLQGDHAGVEMACAAHSQLLKNAGLLPPEEELLSCRPLVSSSKAQGLVIDDYFSISVDPKNSVASQSSMDFETAKRVYLAEGLAGSDDKDVRDADCAKVIGAEINGGRWARQNQVATVASPAIKRFSLSWVSLQVASLPMTTDHLHLSLLGGWTSTMTFRRPFMGLFGSAFDLVKMDSYSPAEAKMINLSRKVAEELTLAAVLCPLMVADISTPFNSRVFATDASESRGAVLEAPIDPVVNEVLFKSFKTKGAYTRLRTPEESLAERLGYREAADGEEEHQVLAGPSRPLAYRFDFIELFAGAAKISGCLSSLGFSTGVPIELSFSEEFNLKWPHLMSWIVYLIVNNLILGLMVEPPCTTFSVMRRPALRSRSQPYGFDVLDEQTMDGNILAHRGLQLLWLCGAHLIAGLLETPNSSKLKFLPSWAAIERKPFAKAIRVDSCQYGSPHLKSFKLLTVHLGILHASKRCSGGHEHVKVEGAFTKASATYTDELAMAIALDFKVAFEKMNFPVQDDIKTSGLEGFLPNEVMLSSSWRVRNDWAFKQESHINLLELRVVLRLVLSLVLEKRSTRVVSFIDSNVCRCALGKGRSSSRAISSILRRLNTYLIAGGIWMVNPYMPTRLNAADDPTRLCSLRQPLIPIGLSELPRSLLFECAKLPRTRRCASGWVRLTILLIGIRCVSYGDKTKYRCHGPSMDFDSTMGFPGEGPFELPICYGLSAWIFLLNFYFVLPLLLLSFLLSSLSLKSCQRVVLPRRYLFWVLVFSNAASGAAMDTFVPRNAADLLRSEQRQRAGPLPVGRLVLPRTADMRSGYLRSFRDWCSLEGIDIDFLVENFRECIDELNLVLCRYGRKLYDIGRPRNHYFETINGLTAAKPGLRRMVQQAWDLGFTWTKMEPSNHHVAAPFQVLMGMISLCILWGWPLMAAALGLMWGALLRPGEFIAAVRSELLLPRDVGSTISFAILSIKEPKTRNVAARHQAARLDIPDLLALVQSVFFNLQKHQKLWPFSGQTLRTRFKAVLDGLGISSMSSAADKTLDLGSLRAGGATWLLETTENGNLVQRRGRWISERVMSLYIQELSANIFLAKLSSPTKQKILSLAHAFPHLTEKAQSLLQANIPFNAWFAIFSTAGKEEPNRQRRG